MNLTHKASWYEKRTVGEINTVNVDNISEIVLNRLPVFVYRNLSFLWDKVQITVKPQHIKKHQLCWVQRGEPRNFYFACLFKICALCFASGFKLV